ncbi:hypothetical protein MMC20_000404 [Loxospora ochrophaea]|nr:hypothetical protein [Loxospora ochrophaea]
MIDLVALIALVVAVVALFIAAIQVTQQLLATSYVARKCDRIVTGGLTSGYSRHWHWRQFRFTVKYQSVIFALPTPLYSILGLNTTVHAVTSSESGKLWGRAKRSRDKRVIEDQGSWVSFVQDLVVSECIHPAGLGLKPESGDRIPEDLTIAPIRVDAATVLLICIAWGMRVLKYSPASAEIALGGGFGGVYSSIHPVLGSLLHYSALSNEPSIGFEAVRRNGRALCHSEGVWAQTIFGNFKDRSFKPQFTLFPELQDQKIPILKKNGWPEGDNTSDTSGGAASFMVFGNVDVYLSVPPSCVRRWCAHFAEVIVAAHVIEIRRENAAIGSGGNVLLSPDFYKCRRNFVDRYGYSSPFLIWEEMNSTNLDGTEKHGDDLALDNQLLRHVDSKLILADAELVEFSLKTALALEHSDPSTYVSTSSAWEAILRADQCMHYLRRIYDHDRNPEFLSSVYRISAAAVSVLADTGPPSWHNAGPLIPKWEGAFSEACSTGLRESEFEGAQRKRIEKYAWLYIHRAAYYTIMMRAAGDVGPGVAEGKVPETALMYMT